MQASTRMLNTVARDLKVIAVKLQNPRIIFLNSDNYVFLLFFSDVTNAVFSGRGLSLSGLALAIIAIVAMGIGMDSSPCGGDDKALKVVQTSMTRIDKKTSFVSLQRRVRMIAGALSCLSALLIVAAVSWYANNVRINHEMATQQLLINSTTSLNR